MTTTAATVVDTVLDRTIAPGYSRIGLAVRRRLPGWPADPAPGALAGKAVAVTGPTSGLGVATAHGVAALGATVHLVVRDTGKGERLAMELRRAHPGAEVTVWRCDASDLDDVRRFAAEFLAGGSRLDGLVHNAGAMPPQRTLSAQGHEMTMALHVLGPVVMTDEVLPAMADRADGARVILVTSGGMYGQALRDDDPQYLRGDYAPATAYARSKRAQVELLPVLQERWGGRGVDVHATHPGWADTPGVQSSLPAFRRLTAPILRDAAAGADTTVWLTGVVPAPEPAGLWHDRRRRPFSLLPTTRTSEEQRQRLWAWTREAARIA
jgi:NAD(P)-dependent dehydrogenase (short-subunit alcohol dehydrogenase family)